MVSPGKGILAADEAITNMGGFTEIGVENIEENRRRWRQLLFEIPDLSTYLRYNNITDISIKLQLNRIILFLLYAGTK